MLKFINFFTKLKTSRFGVYKLQQETLSKVVSGGFFIRYSAYCSLEKAGLCCKSLDVKSTLSQNAPRKYYLTSGYFIARRDTSAILAVQTLSMCPSYPGVVTKQTFFLYSDVTAQHQSKYP